MKLNNKNTNIAGFIIIGFALIYVLLVIFALEKEPSFKAIGVILLFSLLFFSIKNPKIQEFLVKILDKLPIKLK